MEVCGTVMPMLCLHGVRGCSENARKEKSDGGLKEGIVIIDLVERLIGCSVDSLVGTHLCPQDTSLEVHRNYSNSLRT